MGVRRTPTEINRILLFNVAFFGTLAWAGSAARVARTQGWWFELGQFGLVLAGLVLFWMAWWLDDRGRCRDALNFAVPAVALLSVWFTSVHSAL